MQHSEQSDSNDLSFFEMSLRELIIILWNSKSLIFLITSAFAILSIVYALSLTNIYRSDSILVGTDSEEVNSLSKYSGLASSVGVKLPSSGGDEVIEIIEMIQSRAFIKHLLTFENVLPSIMASESYDIAIQKLYFDPEIYDENTKKWMSSKPSYLEVHKAYRGDMLYLEQDKMTGLVFISIEHLSPIFAKEFLALIIQEANWLKRKKDIDASNKALNYLKKELAITSLTGIKQSINQLIEAQLEIQMRAKLTDEYSLIQIEPPYIPERRIKPNRANICILGTMLGGILSVMIVLVRRSFFSKGLTG